MKKGISLLLVFILTTITLLAQTQNGYLTITYQVGVKGNKKASLAADAYDGATKTIFAGADRARIRLVSFMRIQSIYYFDGSPDRRAVVLKESGKKKEKSVLTIAEWKSYNADFDGSSCVLLKETSKIRNYNCRKAIMMLKSGAQITVYYTDELTNKVIQAAEPMFACIPGIVLKYIYSSKSVTTTYTAVRISQDRIADTVFEVN